MIEYERPAGDVPVACRREQMHGPPSRPPERDGLTCDRRLALTAERLRTGLRCYTRGMNEQPQAVVFELSDYAGPGRRLTSFAIDLAAMFVLSVLFIAAASYLIVPQDVYSMKAGPERSRLLNKHMAPAQVPMTLGLFAFFGVYHIMMRSTRRGTIGYRLTGVRLVDHQGLPPALRTLIRRFLVALPGCMCLGAAYLLCSQDPRRQALHDQWSGTWVVRARARPAGPGSVTYHSKLVGPWMLTYINVEPVVGDAAPPAATALS